MTDLLLEIVRKGLAESASADRRRADRLFDAATRERERSQGGDPTLIEALLAGAGALDQRAEMSVHDDVVAGLVEGLRGTPEPPECTGLTAVWCPVHGACECASRIDLNDPACPLHGANSNHADRSQ